MDAQVAYGVGFGRSLYGWKDNLRLFQWNQFQALIHPESTGIARGSWRQVSVPALRRRLSVFGHCIMLEPIRGASRGSCATLETLLAAATSLLWFGFCLDYSIKNSFAAVSVCETPTRVLIIHPQFSRLCSFLFLLASSIRRQGLAFVARLIVQRMVDNQRRSGAAITGFESWWLEVGSFVWHLQQIDSYPHLTEDQDPCSHQVVIRASVITIRLTLVFVRLICLGPTVHEKAIKLFVFLLFPILQPFLPLQFFYFRLLLWSLVPYLCHRVAVSSRVLYLVWVEIESIHLADSRLDVKNFFPLRQYLCFWVFPISTSNGSYGYKIGFARSPLNK